MLFIKSQFICVKFTYCIKINFASPRCSITYSHVTIFRRASPPCFPAATTTKTFCMSRSTPPAEPSLCCITPGWSERNWLSIAIKKILEQNCRSFVYSYISRHTQSRVYLVLSTECYKNKNSCHLAFFSKKLNYNMLLHDSLYFKRLL